MQTKPAGKAATGALSANASAAAEAVTGGGRSLSASERAFFEPRFGRDLSKVRIHDDTRADDAAKSINARAFTLGGHIALANGEYRPGSPEGRRLLAHELAHAVQQGGDSTSGHRTSNAGSGSAQTLRRVPEGPRRIFNRCVLGMGCPSTINCGGKTCAVADCGTGKCPTCPPEFDSLIIRGWCTYRCVPDGSAFILISRLFDINIGPFCLDE